MPNVMQKPNPVPFYFAIYSVSRHYGGPEEGGWYYDAGDLLAYWKLIRREVEVYKSRCHWSQNRRGWVWRTRVREEFRAAMLHYAVMKFGYLPVKPKGYRGRGSVIGGADIEVQFTPRLPQSYPLTTPHYE